MSLGARDDKSETFVVYCYLFSTIIALVGSLLVVANCLQLVAEYAPRRKVMDL